MDLGKGYSVLALEAAKEVRGNRIGVLVLFCVAGFSGATCIIVFGITATIMAERLRLSVLQSAMLTSTSLFFATFAAVPVSLATRVWGGRVLTCVLLVIAGTAMLVLAAVLQWATDLPSLYGLFIVLGLMLGCGEVTVNSGLVHLSWWFPHRAQATVAGTFLFAFCLGSGVFGAFAIPAINSMSIAGFFLFWGMFLYCGAVAALFCFDPPYTQLLRIIRRRGLLVETLPGESAKNLVELAQSHVSQSQLMAVCEDALGQEVFPENAFLRDLRLSLTRLENWCVIGIASFTLGVLLGYLVWIPTFLLGVMGTGAEASGYIVLGYGLTNALGCIGGGFISDRLNVWLSSLVFLVVSIACFIAIGVSTVFGVTVAASLVAGFFVSAANLSAYKLLFLYCNHSASGTIGWCETGGNMVAFALPLIFGAIVDTGPVSASSSTLRIGMAVPASLLAISTVLVLIIFLWQRKQFRTNEPI